MGIPFKPTKEQILAAAGKMNTVPDIIAPGLCLLFVGINPGLYTAAIGHHFGRPGNRFWPALYAAGFTERQLSPFESGELLKSRCGITNLVDRATLRSADLANKELREGGRLLTEKVRRFKPAFAAILGIEAYRRAFGRPRAQVGRQPELLAGSVLWILPNPSGLNAHFTPAHLAEIFRRLKTEVDSECGYSGGRKRNRVDDA